jgi:hypothetical protein
MGKSIRVFKGEAAAGERVKIAAVDIEDASEWKAALPIPVVNCADDQSLDNLGLL